MKKILLVFGFIVGFCLIVAGGYGYYLSESTINLNQIAKKFTSSKVIKDYKDGGIKISATVNNDVLNIKYEGINYRYVLNDNILSTSLKANDFSGAIMLIAVVDSIGQLHGYSDGQTYATLNSDEIKTYTIEKGIETVQMDDTINVKIDIDKKLELVDFSDSYIEVSDLKDLTDSIKGDGSAQTSKGNLIFYKTGYDDEVVITIGEKDELTSNAYKTLLTAIEVIYDKNESILFAQYYPSLESKSFDKYNIELNPKLSDMEAFIFSDSSYKVIRLTIDKTK